MFKRQKTGYTRAVRRAGRRSIGGGRPCSPPCRPLRSPRRRPGSAGLLGLLGCLGLLACAPPPQKSEDAPVGGPGADPAGDPATIDPGDSATAGDLRTPPQLHSEGPTETVVIAVRELPEEFDPLSALDPWAQRIVDDLLFEGLVRRTPEGYPWAAPAFADRCLQEADGRGIRCHLPSDRIFHDGAPVTVDDVVYSLESWLGPRAARLRLSHGLEGLSAIEIDDGPSDDRDPGRWIRIRVDNPDPLLLERIAAMKILPRARRRGRIPAFSREPIGSGPMRLEGVEPERIVLVRDDAVDVDRTGARRIVLRSIADGAQALTLLRRGEVHLLAELAPTYIPKELAKAGMAARFRGYLRSPPIYDLLLYNLREGPQTGPRLRGTLAAAIPWSRIEREVYPWPGLRPAAPIDLEGPRELDLRAIAEGDLEAQGLEPWIAGTDPEADTRGAGIAAADLDALGWGLERGIRQRSTGQLRLPLMWDGSQGLASELSALLRGSWRDLGIQAPSVTAHWGYLTRPLSAGTFTLALVRYASPSASDHHAFFHSCGANNLTGVDDPALDAAIEAYRDARTPALRRDAQRALARRLAELRPVTVLYAPVAILLASRRITGLEFIDDLPRLDRLGLGGEASDAPLLEPADP